MPLPTTISASVSVTGVLALFGPTASGKTDVAEAVAERIPAEIVSADSAALYRGLELLTAAPERPTRLVGVAEVEDEVSVGEYQRLAHEAIDEIVAAGRTPIVVGGTGLYLRAALADMPIPPPPAPQARERWQRLYDADPARAYALLAARDPRAAGRVHPHDRRRVVRALELAEAGWSLSPAEDVLWTEATRLPTTIFGLDMPKEVLDARIEARARRLVERGVVAEARAAAARRLSTTAAKVMGLREFAELPLDAALDAFVRANRRLARYQRKWMRRIPGIVMLDANRPPGEVADELLEVARARERLPRR